MKRYLLLPLLLTTYAACAQFKSADQLEHEALLQENARLKAELARQHRALAVGPNNQTLLVEFVSCLAARRSQQATLTFRLLGNELAHPQTLSCPVSLAGFPAAAPHLKELHFNFLYAASTGQPTQPFSVTLRNVPITWQP